MENEPLSALNGTSWKGQSELWLDPSQNEAVCGESTLQVEAAAFRYTWSHEGKVQKGRLTVKPDGAEWSDTWHQPASVSCRRVPDAWGLLTVFYTYPAGEGPDWGWRIVLSQRPDDTLVLQMTNIAPWGEETRAARLIVARA